MKKKQLFATHYTKRTYSDFSVCFGVFSFAENTVYPVRVREVSGKVLTEIGGRGVRYVLTSLVKMTIIEGVVVLEGG